MTAAPPAPDKASKPGFGAEKRPRGSRTPRQNGAGNGVRSREDVVAAAGRLFSTRGYHGTSMRDLARELGLIGSSLYSHIDSKADLLVEVVERGAVRFQESADRAMGAPGVGLTRLRALVAGHVDVVLDHPDEVRTFLYEAHALDQSHRTKVLAARNRYEQAFRAVLQAGAEDGSLRPDFDPSLAAIILLSILNALERWYSPNGRLSRDELVREILAFGLEGIGP
ncbi:MAG TPA: TetR/AcrR family transcriptional regulator [Acidimicrobiia bacterium]|nr:TetR/AcrR family transcriptional regulator [Acidimicrobiia bacterium]